HVTFFFNDYRDEPFPGEVQQIIPSPKDVATYDLKPQMSAQGVMEATREAILSGEYALIVVNFANPDMVGHTGSLKAAIQACETVDACLAELLSALDKVHGKALITADHGNADQMWEPALNTPHTRHTLNPVEVVIYGEGCEGLKLRSSGRLADIAPTLLQLMQIDNPPSMTGSSLIQ
ncbi:MAG TPA: 2,3-bisphosphoglycerate-independent phosphoglycerate mutase, partial [Opitutae bacterium]|nr:2,3-bisphosphoglycerate-independent phosphoglycerate mutase [Opitutae bacterium]